MARCELRAANGRGDIPCDEWRCLFWRAVDHLGEGNDEHEGCALRYYRMLEGDDSPKAAWLLSVKERMEAEQR